MTDATNYLSLTDASAAFQGIVQRTEARYKTVGDKTLIIIREAILSGVFEPGQRLRQDTLAENIGVSRMPVRYALMQLEIEGLVEFHPHRGAVVRILTPDQIREIYEVRLLLESYALRKSIERGVGAEKIGQLEEIAEEMDRELDGERFLQLRVAFYQELYDADRHPLLTEHIERLRTEVGRYWLYKRVVNKNEVGHHRELLTYIRENDADDAVKWLSAHLNSVGEELASLMEENL